MRNYIIINGINSLTIPGLAINILPPISKPMMRYMREEIDGRDGDINTELGYQAYDRPLEVGLFGDYDINQVIAFFNSKGKITFSDEPDKFYNFQILEKIDFTKLVKFRTATVNIHCQPFKYPVTETPLEEEYEYVEATGTNVTLNNTSEAIFNKIDLLGNTSQNGTPTPSSPIPINVVSGDNEINICGKNLFDKDNLTANYRIASDGAPFYQSGYSLTDYIPVRPNETYYRNVLITTNEALAFYDKNKTFISRKTTGNYFTTTEDTYYIKTDVATANINTTQLEVGSTATTYEPYIGSSYPVYLGVENLFDGVFRQGNRYSTGLSDTTRLFTTQNYQVKSGVSYTISTSLDTSIYKYAINLSATEWPIAGGTSYYYDSGWIYARSFTFTPTQDGYLGITVSKTNGTDSLTPNDIANYTWQLEKGSKANHYTPYGTTPIELCKIGSYQDYIYKDNGSWYLHKEIGKVDTYNETIVRAGSNVSQGLYITTSDIADGAYTSLYSTHQSIHNSTDTSWNNFGGEYISRLYAVAKQIYINKTFSSRAEAVSWLTGLGVKIYYPLATPTNTLIEDTTLLEQLEALKLATSYEGQTNIAQTNNDLPFILDLSALELNSDHLVINNIGNIYSKPTLDLEGSGIVDIYLNDNQILEADLTEAGEIVIDTEAMEATNPSTGLLANRQVTGDYSRIKLDPGENDLRFSGDLTKATITNYERWL